jgi:hypothetical protein
MDMIQEQRQKQNALILWYDPRPNGTMKLAPVDRYCVGISGVLFPTSTTSYIMR